MDATRLSRLRWRCRRGMLENDLILARFLDARGSAMSAEDVAALDRLLDLADGELWDLIAGRAEPADADVAPAGGGAARRVTGSLRRRNEPEPTDRRIGRRSDAVGGAIDRRQRRRTNNPGWSQHHDRPHRHPDLLRRLAVRHLPDPRRARSGPDVIDIRTLYGKTGKFTYDPGFLSTASCNSTITYIDGDKGELLYRGYPIEELAVKCDFMEVCHLLLYGELPNAAQKAEFVEPRDQAHDGQRADAVLPARLPPRCASDGGDDRARRRAVGVLPGLDEPARRAPARHLGDPADRQDADAGRDGVQVLGRPAVHVSAQRPVVRGELHADDVRHAVRGLQGQRRAGARDRPHLHPARRPRAERVDVDGAAVRVVGHQPVRGDRRGRGLPVGPGARRRQRGLPQHALRHPGAGRRREDRRVHRQGQGQELAASS